jgi:hypothetical protein
MSSRCSLALSLLVLCGVAASFTSSCNTAHCEDLRDELFALKKKWQACATDADCFLVGGNVKDCTGILSCNTAVNKMYRRDAERRIASLPEETVDCMLCQSPNCEHGMITLCEPTTKACIIVTELLEPPDAGVEEPDAGEMPDAGGVPDASTGDAG